VDCIEVPVLLTDDDGGNEQADAEDTRRCYYSNTNHCAHRQR